MSDIATVWVPILGRGDWTLSGADLQGNHDLVSAVLISLFTDRVANVDDAIPDGSNDPRGWWADGGQQYPIGSRLWLLQRSKQTDETASKARDFIAEALQWMIDDGAVVRFDIGTEWVKPGQLGAAVIAYRKDGSSVAMKFASVWQGI